MGDRARGVALYATTAVLLAGGVTWWFRAAPGEEIDPMIPQWRASAQQLLPDVPGQDDADTIPLAAGSDHQVVAVVDTGKYQISVVCVGGQNSQVRVSLGEAATDSGRGLDCSDDPQSDRFDVGAAGRLRMFVVVSDAGPVVFRYTLLRIAD
ncbi:DUF6023 family protein [Paractinoplanes globisporus]|uniref:DUF6023 family protein n=1 Tax=Paractinoplanes globisporus TaxID=113565 RepID=A0ABW6WQC2_9ACTN|nr:DUF6023 family protein [Actinoplanes globisporus]